MSLKGVERAWRRMWIAALTRYLARRRRDDGSAHRPPTRPPTTRPPRVLFLRPDRIGDMIVSTGLLRAIAGSREGLRLDVLASPRNAPVIRHDPSIAGVVTLDVRRPWRAVPLVRRLRAASYDVVVDCMPTAPSLTTLLLMIASGARERVGVAGRGNDDALTIAVPPRRGARHIIDHLSALATAFGVDVEATDLSPTLVLTADELSRAGACWDAADGPAPDAARRRLLVNVSAGKASRRWPAESFVEVLREVRARWPDLRVLVIGAPEERERASGIAMRAGAGVAQTAGLRDALALVATADVVLTPDTSISHAASAFRKLVVDLLLHGRAQGWGPYGTPAHALESADETLASLPVAPVLAALVDLLGSLEPAVEPEVTSRRVAPAADVATAASEGEEQRHHEQSDDPEEELQR